MHVLKPLTHAPETGSRNRCHRLPFDARTPSNVIDCLRDPKAVNDVRSCASAQKTGAAIWCRIYGADFGNRFLERVSGARGSSTAFRDVLNHTSAVCAGWMGGWSSGTFCFVNYRVNLTVVAVIVVS